MQEDSLEFDKFRFIGLCYSFVPFRGIFNKIVLFIKAVLCNLIFLFHGGFDGIIRK